MKFLIILPLALYGLTGSAQSTINTKTDPCYSTITTIMKVVASETAKVLDMKVVLDSKAYSIDRGAGTDDRTYHVRLDNGYTYESWFIDVTISDLISPKYTCKVNKFESRMN